MAHKYELETIPIWDAYDQKTECPLCMLEEKARKRYLAFFLGNSVMAPNIRVEVNRTGFCPTHFRQLFNAANNRHPLSLVTHTHLKDLIDDYSLIEERLKSIPKKPGKLFRKRLERYLHLAEKRERSCMICERLERTLDRYVFTIVYLWKTKDDFVEAFRASKGFCYHHVRRVAEMARHVLGRSKLQVFISELVTLQSASMHRLEGELQWYTQKFDYQNDDKPWGTSRDALERAIQKLTGLVVREEDESNT